MASASQFSVDGEETLQGLLEKAGEVRGPPERVQAQLAELSVQTALEILKIARASETSEERESRAALHRLLDSPEAQLFSTALTDRIYRTDSPASAVRILSSLLERTGGGRSFPTVDRIELRAARMFGPLVPKLTMHAVHARLRDEARPYLWDAEPEALKLRLSARREQGFTVNLNYLGEEVFGSEEAEARLAAYCEFASREDIDALSVKLSGIEPHLEILALEDTVQSLLGRVGKILRAAEGRGPGPPLIYFDMEAYRDLAVTEALVTRLLSEAPKSARLGLAIQAYLPESLALISRLSAGSEERVRRGGVPLRLRLVKGANLQMERVEASVRGHLLPIFSTKAEVDAHFKRVLRLCVERAQEGHVLVGVGSHNLFDIAYALLLRQRHELGSRLQMEMLEGMAGSVGQVVSEIGGGVLLYAPAVLSANFSAAVSYLVRRLDENTAPENFLRQASGMAPEDASFKEQAERFLAAVAASQSAVPETFRLQDRKAEAETGLPPRSLDDAFQNASDTDFTRAVNREHLESTLFALKQSKDMSVRPLLGDAPVLSDGAAGPPEEAEQETLGFDPSRPGFSYPVVLAREGDIERALHLAEEYLPRFRSHSLRERGELLLRVADVFEKNRMELIAAMVLDGGKRVGEADVEVSEAIDFARYYATNAQQLGEEREPRGVVVVTPPWNFPLAIAMGGVFGALAAGNTVILKPAPETPYVAFLGARLCHEAGVPRQALLFVPCRDEEAGALITDPRVRAVILTGATETANLFKRMRPDLCLMAETGGKNGAYVSDVCDREQAVSDIVKSAFGHAGQKCSALSVLVLHREIFSDERFKRQLCDAAESLPVGSAWDPRSIVTPLIRPPSGALLQILKRGHEYGEWLLKPRIDEENPRLVTPGILFGVQPGSFPHVTEFFGPVLSVLCADDLETGIALINKTPYGLTAGLYSLKEEEQETFVQGVEAGNLYLNRGTTGAVVARQPFGGHKASCFGPGAKAGGPDYVGQMTACRSNTERKRAFLKQREEEYERVFQEHFARVHVVNEPLGEENYLRYLPGPTALVLGENADAVDLRFALHARKLCRAFHPIFLLDGADVDLRAQLVGQEKGGTLLDSAVRIVEHAATLRLTRLRVVGAASEELLKAAAKAQISVITDPVSVSGRQELILYLLSQTISFSSHRHGNTNLARLSRLGEVLSVWD